MEILLIHSWMENHKMHFLFIGNEKGMKYISFSLVSYLLRYI